MDDPELNQRVVGLLTQESLHIFVDLRLITEREIIVSYERVAVGLGRVRSGILDEVSIKFH
jgi:hypothetical protein